MMRIAIAQRITLTHGIRGGMETQAQALATGLRARGHTPLIFTAPHPDGRALGDEGGITVRYIAPGSFHWYQRRWWNACYAELVARHHNEPFDLLLSQSAGALGYLERAVHELRLPSVVILHGTVAGEIRTRLGDLASPRGLFRLARFLSRAPDLLRRWRRAAPFVAHWIAIAPHVARAARREIGIPLERITTVANGVDVAQFRPDAAARALTRARLGIAQDAPLLVASGRLEREKGFATAIEALALTRRQWPDARLLIAGSGSDAARLDALARPLGGAVQLVGHVPRAELGALLAAGDLYLMPSLCFEGLSLAVLEALAVGLPVLATAGGGAAALRDGVTGLILPAQDAPAWAAAIEGLLANERKRRALGALARQVASAQYSQEQMVAATETIMARVIRSRAAE